MQTKTKRALSAVCAIIVAAALAVGGTFAYRNQERKSNVVSGKARYQARLVEDFDDDQEWDTEKEIIKTAKVVNLGGTNQFKGSNWGEIYVAVQILEYMDITPVNYSYYKGEATEPVRFMVDITGDFVRIPAEDSEGDPISPADLAAAVASYDWTLVIPGTDPENIARRGAFVASLASRISTWTEVQGYFDEEPFYYLPTIPGDPNGQYGAYVVEDASANVAGREAIVGTQRVNANAPHADYVANYEPHLWDDCYLASHDYAELVLGEHEADWILLSEWDGQPVAMWLLDDSPAGQGWAYWGQALPPYTENGPSNETKELLKAIQPIVMPEDEIYYDVYVHMDAYSLSEMPSGWPLYVAPAQPTAPSSISPASLLGATAGVFYSQTLTAAGSKPMTWAVTSGSLPDGLSLSTAGVISGTPTTPGGPYSFTVEATNAGGSATESFNMTVGVAPVSPVITTGTLPDGKVGTAYNETLVATGDLPITWSIDGDLPAGLILDGGTGVISGTPAAAGTFDFNVIALNDAGSATRGLTIIVTTDVLATNTQPENGFPSHIDSDNPELSNTTQALYVSGVEDYHLRFASIALEDILTTPSAIASATVAAVDPALASFINAGNNTFVQPGGVTTWGDGKRSIICEWSNFTPTALATLDDAVTTVWYEGGAPVVTTDVLLSFNGQSATVTVAFYYTHTLMI
ncbi:MAG: Ig domain-containing protein [Oscillospiraceae bacterium]|nr:Ig domain-containing protein [Oscillospiraceae bacterium]